MKVLLLGATGNLGSRLIPALLAHQHQVVLFVRNESKLRELIHSDVISNCTIVSGNATDAAGIETAIVENKCNALINSAGQASIFPWQPPRMQEIINAVVAAAVGASKTLGHPIRAWFLGGLTALDMPNKPGVKIVEYTPIFWEHRLTYDCLLSKPIENLPWSQFAPSQMVPASQEITLLEAPRGNPLVAKNDSPPEWILTYLSSIPYLGVFFDALRNGMRYNTTLEDCADWLAADLSKEKSEHVGHRVGVIEGKKPKAQ
ncbi:MAG: hypothetical protein Q9170_006430 [Blastenia crenularia]